MEIRASFHAATLNLAPNVAKSVEDGIGSGGVEVVMEEVKVCVISKKISMCAIRFFGRVGFHVNANVCLAALEQPSI